MASKSRVLFDVTRLVRGLGWSLQDPEAVRVKLRDMLVTNTLPKAFAEHYVERKFLMDEDDLVVRVLTHQQLQGGRRFLFQYTFARK